MRSNITFLARFSVLILPLLLFALAAPRASALSVPQGSIPRLQLNQGPTDIRGTEALRAEQQPGKSPSAVKKTPIFPVGGFIVAKTYCKNGEFLILALPRPGAYLLPYTPPPLIFANYLTIPGGWILGTAIPGGVCVCPSPKCELAVLGGAIGGFLIAGPVGALIGGLIAGGATTLPALGTFVMEGSSLPGPPVVGF